MFIPSYNLQVVKAPNQWECDLTGDVMLVVGAENAGVSKEVLDAADDIVRLANNAWIYSSGKSKSSVQLSSR